MLLHSKLFRTFRQTLRQGLSRSVLPLRAIRFLKLGYIFSANLTLSRFFFVLRPGLNRLTWPRDPSTVPGAQKLLHSKLFRTFRQTFRQGLSRSVLPLRAIRFLKSGYIFFS
jgi:hypothetical protein